MKNTLSQYFLLTYVLIFLLIGGTNKVVFAGTEPGEEGLWPLRGPLHQNDDLVRMGPEVTLRADCQGVPVHGFGYTYIYGVSPDLEPGVQLQKGNNNPVRKILPKKSWEITSNRIGATPPRMPRTARSDFQPLLGVHLIDGDPQTYWSCRGQNQADVEPAWIRIDLARETQVHSVVLVPRENGQSIPGHLTVKLSRDGWHWETVYDNPNHTTSENTEPQRISFSSQPAKQIWVIGRNLPRNDNSAGTEFNWRTLPIHTFSIAELQVLDESNENVALVSTGAGVTVSSFESWIASQRETHQTLWPTHYDLGVEWIRINYAGSVLNWRIVEREKGVYEIDPEADAAITQAVQNGCKINFGLGFTNWLYTPQGRPSRKEEKQLFQTNENAVTFARADSKEMLEGFKNYVRFMVTYYKDRVDYFEIWNEQSGGYGGWYDAGPELYARWVKEVSPIIKEIDPSARVIMGALSGLGPRRQVGLDWLKSCLEAGIAPYIDAITWHGYYGAAPGSPEWDKYVADVEETKRLAESYDFHGEYIHNEWCIFAPYPDNSSKPVPWLSEMVKAKHLARFVVMNLGLDVIFYWNETWCDGHIDRDVGLFRNTFSASPVSPSQPQPAYYVLRTLCTIFDGARAEKMKVEFSNHEKPLENWTFSQANGNRLVSVSLAGNSADQSPDYTTDILFPGTSFSKATIIDTLNGTEQDINFAAIGSGTVIKNILIKDYPLVIRLMP